MFNNKKVFIVVIFSLISGYAFSQKRSIELMRGYDYSYFTFDTSIKVKDRSRHSFFPLSYSLSFSNRIQDYLYLKAELGANGLGKRVLLSYDEDNPEFDIQWGALSAKFEKYSYYVGIMPEMRFLKNNLIFFNVGYSFFFIKKVNLRAFVILPDQESNI